MTPQRFKKRNQKSKKSSSMDSFPFKPFDTTEFVVMGCKYQSPENYKDLKEEELVSLVKSENFKNGVEVRTKSKNSLLGYVPNQGLTCLVCNSGVNRKSGFCEFCGSEDWEEQGLAYRLIKSGLLNEGDLYLAVVTNISYGEEYPTIKVKVFAKSL